MGTAPKPVTNERCGRGRGRPGRIRALCAVAAVVALAAATAGVTRADASRLSTRQSAAPWSPLVCRQVADGIARQGLRAVLHYHPPLSYYPADTYLLLVRTGVAGFRRHGCRPAVVGRALVRRLTRGQRAELLTHVPPATARYLRRALAAALARGLVTGRYVRSPSGRGTLSMAPEGSELPYRS